MGTLFFSRIRSGDACFLQGGRGNHQKRAMRVTTRQTDKPLDVLRGS